MSNQAVDESTDSIDDSYRDDSYRKEERPREVFVRETSEMLKVNVDGRVWARVGTMIAQTGHVTFEREGSFNRGIATFIKKQLTGENAPLMKIEGQGQVFLADEKKRVFAFQLTGEEISVNGNDLLAFEDEIEWSIKAMTSGTGGLIGGGLFNVSLSGTGTVVITSHGEPLTLQVEDGAPVYTDPQATVAWAGSLTPSMETDISAKALFGRGSGEELQFGFDGDGWVLVQPYEEMYPQQGPQQQQG